MLVRIEHHHLGGDSAKPVCRLSLTQIDVPTNKTILARCTDPNCNARNLALTPAPDKSSLEFDA